MKQGEQNFWKVARLTKKVGTEVVRFLFDKYVSPEKLKQKLMAEKNLVEKIVTDQKQRKILYPEDGNDPKSSNFDLSLTFSLLLDNYYKAKKNHEPKYFITVTEEERELLMELKQYRNDNYAHVSNPSYEEVKFHTLYGNIGTILKALAGNNEDIKANIESLLKDDITIEELQKFREDFSRLLQKGNNVINVIGIVIVLALVSALLAVRWDLIDIMLQKANNVLSFIGISVVVVVSVFLRAPQISNGDKTDISNTPTSSTSYETGSFSFNDSTLAYQLANEISTQGLLTQIGMSLGFSYNDIEKVRQGKEGIGMASLNVLRKWFYNVDEKLGDMDKVQQLGKALAELKRNDIIYNFKLNMLKQLTERCLHDISKSITSETEVSGLGAHLKLSYAEIKKIINDSNKPSASITDAAYDLLSQWMQLNGSLSIEEKKVELKSALKEAGRNDLVKKFKL